MRRIFLMAAMASLMFVGLSASPARAADEGMSEPGDETITTESLDDEDETISTDSMESDSMPEDQIPEDDKIDE